MPQLASPASRKTATISQRAPRLFFLIPSSIAYLDRNGGASAVAVARRSEKIESVVRVRYGAVSRASVASRRRVRRHDQSSTSAPRCIVRWLPACQTLIARDLLLVHARIPTPGGGRSTRHPRRAYRGKAHVSVPGRRRNGKSCDLRLFGFVDDSTSLDSIGELALEQAVLVDVAVDLARLEQIVVRAAGGDASLVDDRGCVVEDQDARVDGDCPGDREPLALSAGQRDPALADHRVVALRQAFDELVCLGEPGDVLDLVVAQTWGAEGDVLADRGGEEESVL